ncbi:MAG: GNAT family N-acetyltransferase [Hyphomicrobiales bacterium]
MDKNITIRRAGRADAPAVHRLLVETWHDTYDGQMGPEDVTKITDAWHTVEKLTAQMETDGHLFLIAEMDGVLAGHVYALEETLSALNLSRLYVLPAAQGQGMGRALLRELEKHFEGAQTIRLEVHQEQHQAHRFYEASGFQIIGKTAHCGGDSDVPALIMEKKLGRQ